MEAADKNGAHCSEIRQLLQEIDPLFEIDFYYPTEEYRITFNGGHFQSVGYNEMDRSVIGHVRETYWLNKTGRILDDIEQGNEKIERSEERQENAFAEDMAEKMFSAAVDRKVYGGVEHDARPSAPRVREEHI